MASSNGDKGRLFWAVLAAVIASDLITKAIASTELMPRGVPREVFGNVVRLTLVYNPGAAFGLHLGPYSRLIFTGLTLGALVILFRLYRNTAAHDVPRTLAIGLVSAGAIGNLIDRVFRPMGVVDFIDIGVGDMRWPTFNVADMAVSTGAFLLAWVLWGEERAERAAPSRAVAPETPQAT
jgi:signal peptidase II